MKQVHLCKLTVTATGYAISENQYEDMLIVLSLSNVMLMIHSKETCTVSCVGQMLEQTCRHLISQFSLFTVFTKLLHGRPRQLLQP